MPINYEALEKRRQDAELLVYICLAENAREVFKEMGFNDAVLELAEESCLLKFMGKLHAKSGGLGHANR
jgi:hypothetical protein